MKKKIYSVGDVVYVDFGEKAAGVHTQGGERPALVVLRFEDTYSVIPITTQKKHRLPTHMPFKCTLGVIGTLLCENVTTVTSSQIEDCKGNVKETTPTLWDGAKKCLGVQLSSYFDRTANLDGKTFRRGNIVVDGNGENYLILSNEKGNETAKNITAIPIANRGRTTPVHFAVKDLQNKTWLCTPQLYNIPKSAITKAVGTLGHARASDAARILLLNIR